MGARARGPKGCTPAASYAVYVVYRFGERIFATRASGLAAMLACDYAVDDHVPCRVDLDENPEQSRCVKQYYALLDDYMQRRGHTGVVHTAGKYVSFAT